MMFLRGEDNGRSHHMRLQRNRKKRLQINITKEIWKGGKEEMEKLLQYVKEIELYNGI
jgi:hypothetical protein